MATRLPAILVDEIMLPGATTEIVLEPAEVAFLSRMGDPDEGAPLTVIVAARHPDHSAPTTLEMRSSGNPGVLADAWLVGQGTILPRGDDEPHERLLLEGTSRLRANCLTADGEGWTGEVAPWPLQSGDVEPGQVADLLARFYGVLLASTTADMDDLASRIERPVDELEGTQNPVMRLMLMADYLFERPDVRHAVLMAEGADTVRDMVADAIELLEAGLPHGARVIRSTLQAYLQDRAQAGLADLARTARVLGAVAPLLDVTDALADETRALRDDLSEMQTRFERVVQRLLRRGRRS